MISQQEILSKLKGIATDFNLKGDGVDAQIGWLSFLFSNYGVEVANAFIESNITSATLMNNKILQCMNVMYSVYRGRNPRLILQDFVQNGNLNANLYDLVYTSNNFYIYAIGQLTYTEESKVLNSNDKYLNTGVSIDPQSKGTYEFLISDKPKYVSEVTIDENNKYYIDVEINKKILSNLSEDIAIYVDGKYIPTTRLFYEHINSSEVISNPNDDESDNNDTNKLFILTIPEFGIRIFNKGYFNVSSTVRIECFNYCTKSYLVERFESELKRIRLKGFDMEVYIDPEDSVDRIDSQGNIIEYKPNYIKDSTDRDDIDSIHYYAIASNHVQSQIMSNSDVDTTFIEYFKDEVLSASHIITQVKDPDSDQLKTKLFIYYITRDPYNELTTQEINEFLNKYSSYYIGKYSGSEKDVEVIKAPFRKLRVDLSLIMKTPEELENTIRNILSSYTKKLPKINQIDSSGGLVTDDEGKILTDSVESIMNYEIVKADITNIQSVSYIKSIELISIDPSDNKTAVNNTELLQLWGQKDDLDRTIPNYLEFEFNIDYQLS